jgi:asparagine synthase (glutamine-hydrolysing)
MCGVAGIVSFNSLDQTNKHRELFAQKALVMQKELSRRGPDGKGFFADQRQACFLVHRKLAITDFTASSDQPMHSPCGRYVIVFNGEVFNFLELKAELLSYGICFKTTSDTEVLLKYFVRFGQRTFAKLKGIFAIVIWDKFENVLHLARDRVGVKPLFYFYDQSKGRFFFASQVVPLVKAGLFEPELDQQSIAQFLRFYCVPYPKTMIKNIVHFPTGHYGTLSASGLF